MPRITRWLTERGTRAGPGPSETRFGATTPLFGWWARLALVLAWTVLGALANGGRGGLLIAVLGALIVLWCALRLRGYAGAWCLPVELVLAAALGLGQVWDGPPSAGSWAIRVASITAAAAFFEWPRRMGVAWAIAVLGVGSTVVGSVLADPSPRLVWVLVPVAVETVLAWSVFLVLRASTRAVDAAGERTARRRRAAEVSAARRNTEREYLATLHDTACTTLLMVSRGAAASDASWVRERARRDLAALLADPREEAEVKDLCVLLAAVVRESDPVVHAELPGPVLLPAPLAAAIVHGMREAIQNIRLHAGIGTARLRLTDGDPEVVVELSDAGRGFDPAAVSPHRRGIAGSIVGRMAAAGGTASVESAPGRGTVVRWTCPRECTGSGARE